MAATKILLDTGPLVGFVSETDQHHIWTLDIWNTLYQPLWTCEAVLSETIFLLQSDGLAIDSLLELFDRELVKIDFSISFHLPEICDLLRKYADQPMSLADASLVRMAELHEHCQVFTTDKDFKFYRRKGRGVIPLLAPF